MLAWGPAAAMGCHSVCFRGFRGYIPFLITSFPLFLGVREQARSYGRDVGMARELNRTRR